MQISHTVPSPDTFGSDDAVEICDSQSGAPTLIVQSGNVRRALHSRYDPVKEAERLLENTNPPRRDVLVIFGNGLGYVSRAAAVREFSSIIVIEHDERFAHAWASRYKDAPLPDNMIICVGESPRTLEKILTQYFHPAVNSGIEIVEIRAIVDCAAEYYHSCRAMIEKVINQSVGETATLRHFGLRWLCNFFRNMTRLNRTFSLHPLKKLIAQKPVSIISAGPSLDIYASLLPQIMSKTVVIAVDTAYRALVQRGIKPDIVLSVDPHPMSHKHFIKTPRILVTDSISASTLPYGETNYWFLSPYPLNQWLTAQSEYSLMPSVGGAVTTAAVALAHECDAGDIFLVGADLSYMRGKPYARGTYLESLWCEKTGRFLSLETQAELLCRHRGVRTFRGTRTSAAMTGYAQWLEEFSAAHPSRQYYNFYCSGVKLNNYIALNKKDVANIVDKLSVVKKNVPRFDDASADTSAVRRRLSSMVDAMKAPEILAACSLAEQTLGCADRARSVCGRLVQTLC